MLVSIYRIYHVTSQNICHNFYSHEILNSQRIYVIFCDHLSNLNLKNALIRNTVDTEIMNLNRLEKRSRYSYWLPAGRPRSRSSSSGRVKNFLFSKSSRPALGSTHPHIQWLPGVLSVEVKWPGREADHSSPASAEVKKIWIYTSTPPHSFMA
jgi:hypothetical protein